MPLGPYTPLVGQNNTGKSTILQAIRWALKPSALKASDFCDLSKPLAVSMKIEGVTEEILRRVPERKHRTAIAPYCRDGVLWIRVHATGTKANAQSRHVWDADRYSGEDVPAVWRDYPTGLPQAVSALLPEPLYIEAMHDVTEDLGKAKAGTTIKRLLDEIMTPVLSAHSELQEALDTMRGVLSVSGKSRSSHLEDFDAQSTKALEAFFPGLLLDLDIQVVDIRDLFKAGDLNVTDKTTNDRRRFDEMGTGAQRAIQMALVRYLAQLRYPDSEAKSRRLLLIDEPELYLHPQGVVRLRNALGQLSERGFQVVFSTHSPLMLSRENAADTLIVRKTDASGAAVRIPLRDAVEKALQDAESQSRTLFELGNLAEIYFSDKVVLCEGKTDRRLMPLAYERLYAESPESAGISFVSVGSCADIPKALPVLRAMGISACAVADLDFAFTHARVGSHALLTLDSPEMNEAKRLLATLAADSGIALGDNGLPVKSKTGGLTAAEAWERFAAHADGSSIVGVVHEQLKYKSVWIWKEGSIETITGRARKGEGAIIDQEHLLLSQGASQIEATMPALKYCLDWVRAQ